MASSDIICLSAEGLHKCLHMPDGAHAPLPFEHLNADSFPEVSHPCLATLEGDLLRDS